jgi:hypothetical protein
MTGSTMTTAASTTGMMPSSASSTSADDVPRARRPRVLRPDRNRRPRGSARQGRQRCRGNRAVGHEHRLPRLPRGARRTRGSRCEARGRGACRQDDAREVSGASVNRAQAACLVSLAVMPKCTCRDSPDAAAEPSPRGSDTPQHMMAPTEPTVIIDVAHKLDECASLPRRTA